MAYALLLRTSMNLLLRNSENAIREIFFHEAEFTNYEHQNLLN